MEEVKRTFRPEFINRVDEIIVFHSLEPQHLQQIVSLMLQEVRERVEESGYHLEVSDTAKALIAREGYDPTFGARPLRRAIQRLIENPLAGELLAGRYQQGDTIWVDTENDHLIFGKNPVVAEAKG